MSTPTIKKLFYGSYLGSLEKVVNNLYYYLVQYDSNHYPHPIDTKEEQIKYIQFLNSNLPEHSPFYEFVDGDVFDPDSDISIYANFLEDVDFAGDIAGTLQDINDGTSTGFLEDVGFSLDLEIHNIEVHQ